jgi:predicted nucleic acid-binding protein
MILVDTSVWIDHLRWPDARLGATLENGDVVMHPDRQLATVAARLDLAHS